MVFDWLQDIVSEFLFTLRFFASAARKRRNIWATLEFSRQNYDIQPISQIGYNSQFGI